MGGLNLPPTLDRHWRGNSGLFASGQACLPRGASELDLGFMADRDAGSDLVAVAPPRFTPLF